MAPPKPLTELDPRYGDEGAGPTSWIEAGRLVAAAELSWLTTLRPDGGPHTTPLITVVHDEMIHFATGPAEQKARNLARDSRCSMNTGTNRWAEGTDVVVEGHAERVSDGATLEALAATYLDKYGTDWSFDVADGAFVADGHTAHVFRVVPSTAYAFAKGPPSHTRFTFGAG